jgi:tetratricopeptide (TPR) repeat protein
MLRYPLPRRAVLLALVICFAASVFGAAFAGDFVSDDRTLIQARGVDLQDVVSARFWQRPDGMDSQGLYLRAYRPTAQLLSALQLRAFGDVTPGYHLVSFALHALICVLVLRWIERRLCGENDDESTRAARGYAALFGALLFAIHPLHAESVSWISGATDLYMTVGLLAALELLERGSNASLLCAGFALLFALLAKEPIAVAPALWLVDAWALPAAGPLSSRKTLRGAAVLTLAVMVGLGLIAWVGWPQGRDQGDMLPHVRTFVSLIGQYLQMSIVPGPLAFQACSFDVDASGTHFSSWSLALGGAGLLLTAALCVLASRNPRWRPWLADSAWFWLLLAPAPLLLHDLVSQRFLYAPSLGLAALAARALFVALRAPRALPGVLAVTLALLYGAWCLPAAMRASAAFRSEEALWRSQVALHPNAWNANGALAEELLRLGRVAQAAPYLERAFRGTEAVKLRDFTLRFGITLMTLPMRNRPAWDESASAITRARCTELFERSILRYERGAVRLSMTLRPREWERARHDVSLLGPCVQAALQMQDQRSALAWLGAAASDPKAALALVELQVVAFALAGSFDDAQVVLRKWREAAHGPGDIAELAARVDAARAEYTQQSGDAAKDALHKARAALILGTPYAARAAIAAELEAHPADHELVHMQAQIFFTEGRFAEASAALERAAAAAPDDPFWHEARLALEAAQRGTGNAP